MGFIDIGRDAEVEVGKWRGDGGADLMTLQKLRTFSNAAFKEGKNFLWRHQWSDELNLGVVQVSQVNELFEKQTRIEVGSVPLFCSVNDIRERGVPLRHYEVEIDIILVGPPAAESRMSDEDGRAGRGVGRSFAGWLRFADAASGRSRVCWRCAGELEMGRLTV
jgi:hypothetical protein